MANNYNSNHGYASYDLDAAAGEQPQFGSFDYGSYGQAEGAAGAPMGVTDHYNNPNLEFAQFNYDQTASNFGYAATPDVAARGYSDYASGGYATHGYSGNIMEPTMPAAYAAPSGGAYDAHNEPPLLEELGINFDHIFQKTLTVLNPVRQTTLQVLQDTDFAGPFIFGFAFGSALLLSGKVHFGYIYGLAVVGFFAMYGLLNLMSRSGVTFNCIVSTLGYCVLPMVFLSCLAVVVSLRSAFGLVASIVAVVWCSFSAAKLFSQVLLMDKQLLLVMYPCFLVYGVFALLTVF